MPRVVVALLALVTLVAIPRLARADADLYTIGPGSYLFARYGHSLVCVEGRCYDYGVPDREDAFHMGWASIRGEPIFVPVAIDEAVAVRVFRDQGRSIERQRLPLSPDETKRFAARLETDVRERHPYAYHPYFANCTTQVRDRLDEATGGRLREGRTTPIKVRFRDLSEEGLSGRLGELTLLAILLGDPAERKPSPWEEMFLPEALRDGVAERLGVTPERLEERKEVILPTSRVIGRAALVVLAVVLAGMVNWGARGKGRRPRITLALASAVLGGMGLVADVVAVLVVWPEFRHNWALLALVPTDLLMPKMSARTLRIYALARASIAGILAGLEVVGVVAQPLLPVMVLVVLPMLAVASVAKQRAQTRAPSPALAAG